MAVVRTYVPRFMMGMRREEGGDAFVGAEAEVVWEAWGTKTAAKGSEK